MQGVIDFTTAHYTTMKKKEQATHITLTYQTSLTNLEFEPPYNELEKRY